MQKKASPFWRRLAFFVVNNLFGFDFLDEEFVACFQHGVFAATLRADFRVFDGVIDLAAIKAGGIGVDRVDLQLGILEEFLVFGEPMPGVDEVVGDDARHGADA